MCLRESICPQGVREQVHKKDWHTNKTSTAENGRTRVVPTECSVPAVARGGCDGPKSHEFVELKIMLTLFSFSFHAHLSCASSGGK